METYNKKYKIVAPDGYVEEWSQADFEKGGAALMSDNPDVKVYSQESYDPTQQYGTNVAYGIEDEDGYFESWTADEWSKGKDALLKDHPNLKIYVLGDASQDYHRQKAEEQRQAITDFDAANKDFIRAHELDSLIMSEGGAVSADYDANDKKYNDLLAEREQLVSNYATNPANKQDWSASAQYADQIASNYESKLKGMRDATRFSNAATSMYSGNIRENNDYVLYEQARKLAKDAAKAYAAPSYGEHTGFGGYVKDMGTGAGKVFSDVDFWSRGLSAIDRDKNVRKIVNSLSEKGINVLEATEKELYDNLSPAQIALISSFLLDAQAQYERSLDTARGYNAGVTFAESIGYMAEFLATGGIARAVGSAGKAASSGFGKLLANELSKGSEAAIKSKVSQGLINTFTKGGTKSLSKSAKAATNIASKAVGKAYSYGIRPAGSAIWHTALQPSTYRTISENLTQINDNGDLVKAGSAIWGGVLDQLIENWSESMGGAVEDILGLPLKGVGAAGEKILGKTTLGQWGKWLADSASAKVLHEAGFNGLIGEMGEEWLGNAARVGLGLMTKDEFKDFASFESQVDMAASFAPMTLFGLGTSSYAAAKQDKNYRKLAKDMRGVLNRAGWSEEDVADVMDVKHTKEEIARTLAPVLQSIVRNSQDGKVAQEDYITTLKFAQAAAIQEVLSSAQTIEQERARKEMQEEIAQNLGAVPQEFKNEDGTTVIYPTDNRGNFSYTQVAQTPSGNYGVNVVTTAKDAKGEYFVIPDDDSDTMLLKNRNDANATPRFISRLEFQEQVDAGLMTTETSTLDNYLDAMIEEKREMQRKYAENAQLEDKYQQVAQKMQVGSKINAGTEDAPMEGIVLAVDRGGVTVDFGQPVLLNGRNMQIHKLSLEQAGNFVGIDARTESEQRSVEEQVEQDEINSAKVKAYNQSLAGEQFTVDGHLYTYVHMFEMPQLDDDGTEIAHIVATDEQGRDVEMDIPLEDIKTRETDAAVKTNEQVEEVKDDNVLRDIHGNPIPMRVNEKTQQQEVDKRTFKNKDPEAYYAWNDAQRGGNTEDSMQAITADIASETAQLTALQKQLTVETDPDMRDELHESVNKTQNRINLLEGIYHKYDAENNFQDEQLDFARRIYDVQSKLINAKTQEQVDALIKIKADLFRHYQLATVDSAENVMLARRAVELQQVINSVADVPVQVVFESNIEAVMRTDGASEASINRVLSKVAELRSARITSGKDLVMTGLYNEGKVYIFAEGNTDASSALLTYYHERQHMRTAEDPEAMNKVLVLARNERDNLIQVLSLLTDNIAPYQGANNQELADEIVASAMERACTDEKYEQTLRSRGLSEELINIIKTEYAKQRRITDSDAVRQEDWNANVRTSDTGNGQQDGAVEQGASGNGQLGTAQLSTDTGISEEEPQVDTTPRDFRGNPLPLEADGTTVDQKTLWENDPEAWARWNDDINNDAGADSIAYINAVIEKLNKAIKTNEKAYAKATDFDKRDKLKGQIKEEKQRLDELHAILRAYRQKQSEEASAKMQADAARARAEMAASGQADLFLGAVEAKEQIIKEILDEYGYNTETFTAAAAEQRPGQQSEQQSKQGSSEEQAPDAVSGDAGSGAEEINQVRAIEEQRKVVDTEPTEAQKEAGNYRMGHVRIDGLDITIENPRGSIRKGTDADGHEWQTEMHNDYGYIRGTKAVDNDHIDVFLSDNPTRGKVYVVDQVDPKTGEFDESKVMYGFDSEQDAREAYLSNYEDGWQGLGKITEVGKEEFKKWIDSSTRKTKPFSEYASVKAAEAKKENTTDNQGNPVNEDGTLKVEKIKSIDDLTDSDFSKPYRNVALPDLPENVNSAIGADGKPVIIKKSIFEKVSKAHSFAADESRNILKEALYNPDIVGQSQPKSKKNNWIAIKIDDSSPIVVLEVNRNKDNVEIVGWYTLDNRNLERIKRQAEREDGELLILTPKGAAASLSTLPFDLSSDGKSTQSSETKQENGELSDFATEIFNDTLSGIPEEVRARVTVRESSTGDEVEENFIQSYDLDGKPSGISRVELIDAKIGENPTRFVIDGSDVDAPKQEQERWQQLADEYKQLNSGVIIIDWEECGISFRTFKEALDFITWTESFDRQGAAIKFQMVDKILSDNSPGVKDFAEKYSVSPKDVEDYAKGMRLGTGSGCGYALANIRRNFRLANSTLNFAEFSREYATLKQELFDKFGDYDKLKAQQIAEADARRDAMEAARKRIEEEQQRKKAEYEARIARYKGMSLNELDSEYFKALENKDEVSARDVVDEVARRNGYADVASDYQGAGAWAAPSRPGGYTDEERRASLETDSPDLSLEDISLGYTMQPDDIFDHPERYMQSDSTSKEAARAIKATLNALKKGNKDVKIKVFRAVPLSVKEGRLRNGDWVTPSRAYADMHGNHRLDGEYRVIEEEVPAKDLWWDGNDVREWGYDNGKGYRYKNVENNTKRNDVITRDDKGNIIPPSKRFDSGKADERYQISGRKAIDEKSEESRIAYEAVKEQLDRIGIPVELLSDQAMREMAINVNALETVSSQDEYQQTVVSSASGAKVINNLDNLAKSLENEPKTKEKTFLGALAKALDAKKHGSNSQYATFEAKNGTVVTIRLANHNAATSTFDNHGENDGISIMVSARENNGITNDGKAHVTEFYYDAIKLRKAEGKPLVDIVKSVKQSLYSGEYKDTTGLAQREEVNAKDVPEFMTVYHGSGAKFDKFDHSHMGEGEGVQAYGWGTYVTEVEGIGRTYAKAAAAKYDGAQQKRNLYTVDIPEDINSALSKDEILKGLDSIGKELFSGYGLNDVQINAVFGTTREWYKFGFTATSSYFPLKEAFKAYGIDAETIDKRIHDKAKEDRQKNPARYGFYLNWAGRIDMWIEKLGISEDEYERYDMATGRDAYRYLESKLGGAKEASDYLSDHGYVGISYPAQYMSGGRSDGARNYVIFNENNAKIVDRIEFLREPDGTVYGATVGGKIYLNRERLNPNTPIHEYTHLWFSALEKANPELYKRGVELMRQLPIWEEVKTDPNYANLSGDDAIASECLSRLVGGKGADVLTKMAKDANVRGDILGTAHRISLIEEFKDWLKKFWTWVRDSFTPWTKEEAARVSVNDIQNMVLSDLAKGVNPRKMDKDEDGVRFSAKQKRALETATWQQHDVEANQATVVSSAAGAKIVKNLDTLANTLEEKTSNRSKTFIGDIARALGASEKGSSSQYATFETVNGSVVTIRLANHNASSARFDNAGRDNAISIVITNRNNEGVLNDGDAHIVEFYYNKGKLTRADGKPLAEIVRSIKQALYSGEFKDTTGLAERQEVNGDDFEDLIKRNPGSFDAPENGIRFRIVTEPKLIEQLNLEPTVKVFRAMQIVDGELFPPMSITVNGKKREPSKIGQWEQSEENPELADEDGYFKLNKGKNDEGENKSLKAKYNPYFHTSLFPLNDQFSEAQTRSNIVIVEGRVPKSELTSGYHAEKAKDSVGKMTWHSGPVAGILGQYEGKEREVILSRWFKPERIVPYDQIADISVQMFKGTSLEKNPLPSNVFHPELRNELEKRGVSFVETNNRGRLLDDAEGRTWSSLYGKEAAGKKARIEAKEQDVVDMFYDEEMEVANEIFNKELQQQIDGKLPSDHIYRMGQPGRILLSTGVPDLPIQMNASRLKTKATSYGHDFELSEIKDLVKALQTPLAVFAYGDKSKAQNIIVPLQKDGKNFIVGLSLNPTVGGRSLEINSIRNVFPKNNYEWLNWISQGKTLYLNKEKVQTLINQQRTILADVEYLDLNSVANIVKSFENPRVSSENIAEKGDMLPDDARFRIVGGNSGYVGYSMSKRAAEAKEEGRFPKTQFVKEYGVPAAHLDALVAAGIISNDEWHHTSKFGNKTPFYGWVEDSFLQAYNDNKAAIEDIIEQYNGTDPLSFTERRKLAEKIAAIIESSESVVSAREPAEALIAQREAEKAHRRGVMSEMANSDGKIKKSGNEYWYNADNQVSLHMRDNGRIIDIEFPIGTKTQSQRDELYKAAQEEFREAYERAEKILQDKENENSAESKQAPDVESSESRFTVVKSYDGLQSFGKDKLFDIMHKTFAGLPESTRTKITKLAPAHGYKFHEATADYFASLATKKDLSEEEKMDVMVVRDNIKAALDIDYLSCSEALWALYNTVNKNSKDILSIARRTLVADKLGFMPEDRSKRDDVKDGVRFSIRENSHDASAAEIYNKATSYWYSRLRESYVDMNESVNDLVAAIESTTKQPAQAFEDVRLAINRQSSKGLNQMTKFMSDYLEPMWGAVGKVMEATGMTYDEVVRYVMLKHAVERNDVFARRDARRFYERKCDSIISKLKDEKKQKENMRKRAMANAEISIAYALDQEIQNIDKRIDSALKSLDRQLVKVDNGTSTKYKELREQDYGGLTSMYSKYPGLGARSDYATDEEYNKAARKVRVPMYDNVSDMENAARSEVNAFENRTSGDEFNELWRRINAATEKTLESQYDNNIISREQYNAARDQFKYYVPLRGFKDTEAEDIWTYMDVSLSGSFAPALKNAKGRKSEAENPFNWIGTMASSAIAQNVKNEAKLALYYFIANRPNQDLVTIGKVWYQYDAAATAAHAAANPGDTKKIFTPVYPPVTTGLDSTAAKDAYDTWEADMRAKAAAGEAYLRTNKLNVQDDVAFISDKQVPQHVIKLKVRGEEVNLYINGDPRAAQAINGMLNIETNGGYQKVFGPILRWMSAVNTSYNPEFWISNLQRDFLFALMSSSITGEGANNLLKGFVNPKKIMQMMRDYEAGKLGNSREENYYREFAEGGGITGFTVIVGNEVWEKKIQEYLNPSDFAKISKSIKFDKFLKFFNDLGEAVEQMSRFAAFISARDAGKSIEEAVAASKEITVNFNRKGSGKVVDWADLDKLTTADGAKLNKAQKLAVFTASFIPAYGRRFIMFFNAAVQGANAMYKLWKKDQRKTLAWASGYFAIGVLQAVLHALADDDDDYLDIPDYTRRSNLLLGGGGIYFKWALPQEMRPFYACGDIFVNQVMGREPNKNMLLEMANSAADILPLGPGGVLPSVIQPSWDLYTNKDFTGSRIYNDNKYLSEAEREARPNYKNPRPQTNKLFIDISQVLNALSGGDEYSAGAVNVHPESMQHVVESLGGGLLTTMNKTEETVAGALGAIIGEDMIDQDLSVRRFPFLNRVLMVNDERTRNSHVSDLYYYYKDMSNVVEDKMRRMKKEMNYDALEKLQNSPEYEVYQIVKSYKKMMQRYDDDLKAEEDRNERKNIMREQDELRKEMINEISQTR